MGIYNPPNLNHIQGNVIFDDDVTIGGDLFANYIESDSDFVCPGNGDFGNITSNGSISTFGVGAFLSVAGNAIFAQNITANNLPIADDNTGRFWKDTAGGLNIVKVSI